MASVSSQTTAKRVISGVTQLDVTHTADDGTTISRTLTIPDNTTIAGAQAIMAADAVAWYNTDKWRDDLDALLTASPIVTNPLA